MASETLSVVAERGDFQDEEILACDDVGITAYVPKPMTSGAKAGGRFNNDAFIYGTAKKRIHLSRWSSVDLALFQD